MMDVANLAYKVKYSAPADFFSGWRLFGRHFAVDKLRHDDVVHVILPFSSSPVVCQKYPFIFLFLAVEFLSATKGKP